MSFVVYINGAKFEEHSSNIPRDIHDSVLHLFVEQLMTSSLSSFAYIKNVNISKTKKDIVKRKTPFVFILKSI